MFYAVLRLFKKNPLLRGLKYSGIFLMSRGRNFGTSKLELPLSKYMTPTLKITLP